MPQAFDREKSICKSLLQKRREPHPVPDEGSIFTQVSHATTKITGKPFSPELWDSEHCHAWTNKRQLDHVLRCSNASLLRTIVDYTMSRLMLKRTEARATDH